VFQTATAKYAQSDVKVNIIYIGYTQSIQRVYTLYRVYTECMMNSIRVNTQVLHNKKGGYNVQVVYSVEMSWS
jgi:hypothetical protein